MGFLCINNENKQDVNLEDLKQEKFLRDIGLNNVNNLNPEINFCQEIFLNPEYYVTGAIKLTSGYTSNLTGCTSGTTGIYNLDYDGDINLKFTFTGNTDFESYSGSFCTKIFSNQYWNADKATGGFVNGSELVNNCVSFSAITISEPDVLEGQVAVGTLPYWISHNTNDRLIYVTNQGTSNNISVIDDSTNTVINTITPGFVPAAMAYDPVNNQLFVVEDSTTNLHVLDCNTNTFTTTFVGVGIANFQKIAYNPTNLKMYVTSADDNVTRVICSTITLDGTTTLTAGVVADDIVYNSVDNTMYVTNNTTHTIEIIDCSTDTLQSNITFTGSELLIKQTYNSINNKIYVTDYNNDNIIIIDCSIGTYTTITTPTSNPYAIDFDSISNNIFFSTFVFGRVYRLDCVTNEFEKYFDISAEARFILYNSLNNTVYGTKYASQMVFYITSNYVEVNLPEGTLTKTWAEYLIRPYYQFVTKECSPGIVFNSWNSSVQFNTYQNDTDYYFMTVVNPPIPLLATPPGVATYANQTLVTDRLFINGISGPQGPQAINGSLNFFILGGIPYDNQILLVLNGVQLAQGYDFNLISQGFGVPPIVEVYGEIKPTDWLLATYITGKPLAATSDFGSYKIETIKLDGFTTNTIPSYRQPGDNTLNYNPNTNKYEYFTSYPIDSTNSILLTVNGVEMVYNEQFFVSTSFDGRIIFDQNSTVFNIGDIISVLYVTKLNGTNNNNYGSLTTNEFTTSWTVPTTFSNSNVTGRFIVDVYDNTTNNLLFKNYVNFVPGESNYTSTFTSLPLNVYFKFVVTFEATYTGYLNNKVITCSQSEGFFDTTGSLINNTY